ncbi:hypothetical protein PIB30_005472 [Stylosanthes scabra]|uniref:Reverse transcriptase/retrotransposon-derived protein RNase H-like domain-containing protein n=1 Tax=Stylosanthes scabra TaxID=79078 RepID=A0ABU6Z0Q1_9FABA|nr:hypothetical protein [Stylosanthes scabra]
MKQSESLKEMQSLKRTIDSTLKIPSYLCNKSSIAIQTHEERSRVQVDRRMQKTFKSFKNYLVAPPILIKAEEGKPLVLYLTATKEAVAGALVVRAFKEEKGTFREEANKAARKESHERFQEKAHSEKVSSKLLGKKGTNHFLEER